MRASVCRAATALAVAASLALAVPVVAGADPGSGHAQQAYRQEVAAIDRQFQQAVIAAKQALSYALAHATSPGQRSTARARYALAIAVATTQRDQALVALGAPPRDSVDASGSGFTRPSGP